MSHKEEERKRGRKSLTPGRPSKAERVKTPKKQKISGVVSQTVEKNPEVIPESLLFTQLQDMEKKMDYYIARKQIELGETFRARTNRVIRTIRLNISNTYDNQIATYHLDYKADSALKDPPSWTLRIDGTVLDTAQLVAASPSKAPVPHVPQKRKFSSFFNKVTIILDPKIEDNIIEWHKPVTGCEVDGFEIKRACNFPSTAIIQLHIDYNPPRFKLSQSLSQVLNVHTETRTRVIVLMWQYIKLHRLVDPDDKRQVLLNEPLKKLFGCDKTAFTSLPDMLREHLGPADPIEFTYQIRTSGDTSTFDQTYQIHIEEDDDPILQQLNLSPARKKEVVTLDEVISRSIVSVHDHAKKREFMYAFATDPINFINTLVMNQIRDIKLARSEEAREAEDERHSYFFNQPYTLEAVARFLNSIGAGNSSNSAAATTNA
eukprot:TRINITY_DN16433_c0_g1_i1.p1 TRINITY_DN16433_c0_g1~~TRINITY_DN16433_c0_g1_i1.p1  ORF type:complete len:432 (+),score=110.78 TRINITY_DN16433_c0_g1_i1:52-1347(+)